MNLSQLKIWACAASLIAAGALMAQAQELTQQPTQHLRRRLHRSRQWGHQPLRHRSHSRRVPARCSQATSWSATSTTVEPARHGNHDRADFSRRHHQPVRSDRREQSPRSVPRRNWIDYRIGRLALGMGHRWQPADHRWHRRHSAGRMPARARQPWQCLGDVLWLADQRPLGHDGVDGGSTATLFVTNVLNGTVAGGGKVVHGGTVTRLTLAFRPRSAPLCSRSRSLDRASPSVPIRRRW